MQPVHALRDVFGPLDLLDEWNLNVAVQDVEKITARHQFSDNSEVRGLSARTHKEHNIRVTQVTGEEQELVNLFGGPWRYYNHMLILLLMHMTRVFVLTNRNVAHNGEWIHNLKLKKIN